MRPALLLPVLLSFTAHAQFTETFENGLANGATSFESPNGDVFLLTNDLRVMRLETFGAHSSDQFIDTGLQLGNTNTPPAQLVLSDPNKTFMVDSMAMWTSATDGTTYAFGPITLTGVGPSGTRTVAFNVSPTSDSGEGWDFIDLTGSLLDGFAMQSLSFSYSGSLNYLAVDDLSYRIQPIAGVAERGFSTSVSIYPVPATDQATLRFGELREVQVRLFNAQGALVGTRSGKSEQLALDLAHLPTGPYAAHIRSGEEGTVVRFMKQ